MTSNDLQCPPMTSNVLQWSPMQWLTGWLLSACGRVLILMIYKEHQEFPPESVIKKTNQIALSHSDYILTTFWLHSGYILATFWLHSYYVLSTYWLHSDNILSRSQPTSEEVNILSNNIDHNFFEGLACHIAKFAFFLGIIDHVHLCRAATNISPVIFQLGHY